MERNAMYTLTFEGEPGKPCFAKADCEMGCCLHPDGPPIGEPCPGLGVRNPDGSGCPARLAERMAPVQGYVAGIPWSLHLRAWDEYHKRGLSSQDAETIARRGGFGVEELDSFLPDWRKEIDGIIATPAPPLREAVGAMNDAVKQVSLGEGALDNSPPFRNAPIEYLINNLCAKWGELKAALAQPASPPPALVDGLRDDGSHKAIHRISAEDGLRVYGDTIATPAPNDWVAVSERLPEKEGDYLVWTKESVSAKTSQYYRGEWGLNATITHWMPLPSAPEER